VGKTNLTTFGPTLETFWKNPLVPLLEKILPTPMGLCVEHADLVVGLESSVDSNILASHRG